NRLQNDRECILLPESSNLYHHVFSYTTRRSATGRSEPSPLPRLLAVPRQGWINSFQLFLSQRPLVSTVHLFARVQRSARSPSLRVYRGHCAGLPPLPCGGLRPASLPRTP